MSLKQILMESLPPRLSKVTRVVEGVADKIIESLRIGTVLDEDRDELMNVIYEQTEENIAYEEQVGSNMTISELIQSEHDTYLNRFKDLPDLLNSPSVDIFRLMWLVDVGDLVEHLGYHWVSNPKLFNDPYWRAEIQTTHDYPSSDLHDEYVLCGEIDPRQIDAILTACARIRYPDEQEITLTGRVTADRFRSLYFYRLENLDPKDIHNGNYLKKLK